jgi:hypothetical protein
MAPHVQSYKATEKHVDTNKSKGIKNVTKYRYGLTMLASALTYM